MTPVEKRAILRKPPFPHGGFLRLGYCNSMATVAFTKKQTAHTRAILREWLRLADERGTLPPWLHMKLALLVGMVEDGMNFTNEDFELLAELLQLTLRSLGPDEVDPLAEQAYAKCTGEWLILPPWYDRIRALSVDCVEPPIGT